MCDLLRAFSRMGAIKVTRGHYRSCGKDPNACVLAILLSDEPVIRSGPRAELRARQRHRPLLGRGRHERSLADRNGRAGRAGNQSKLLSAVTAPGVFIEWQ